jgi:hypothetical protein
VAIPWALRACGSHTFETLFHGSIASFRRCRWFCLPRRSRLQRRNCFLSLSYLLLAIVVASAYVQAFPFRRQRRAVSLARQQRHGGGTDKIGGTFSAAACKTLQSKPAAHHLSHHSAKSRWHVRCIGTCNGPR